MKISLLGLLLCISAAYSYTCPDEGTDFYHADVSTGCQVYHHCIGLEMTTLSCQEGSAFDVHEEVCKPSSQVECVDDIHSRHKRSEGNVHSISLEDAREDLEELLESLKCILEEALGEIAPSIYEQIKTTYAPFMEELKEDILPFAKEWILPRVQKILRHVKQYGERVTEKIRTSWEMSNSTHINIVSFSDIIEDISEELKPIMKMGRFLTKHASSSRFKRQISNMNRLLSFKESLVAMVDPLFAKFLPAFRNTLIGPEHTVKNKVILPIIFDMLQNQQTRRDLTRLLFITKGAFEPIISIMWRQQDFTSYRGTVIQIPTEQILAAKANFKAQAEPLLIRVLEQYLPMILQRAADNLNLIIDEIESLKQTSYPYFLELKQRILAFKFKHGDLLLNSDSTHLFTYSLLEIKEDLIPIGRCLLEIFMDKLSREPNSFIGSFLNRNSFLYSMLTAEFQHQPAGSSYQHLDRRIAPRQMRPFQPRATYGRARFG